MSKLTFDQSFEAAVGISSILIVFSAAWIIYVLITIEKTKAVAFSSALESDDASPGVGGDLQFEESTVSSGKQQIEVEPAEGRRNEGGSAAPSSPDPSTKKKGGRRKRRVSGMFVGIQCLSVSVLILLTYLLLVVSNAPIVLRILGSLCVFGVFLRYQIGDELRRQRIDRIMLLLSLFLVIASMLSVLTYSMKTLLQGEIYEGPARIVGYDMEQYNNSQHDPTTRTDIAVSWGKNWGCPLSGGRVCQARIQGAMCQVHPEKESTKHKPNYDKGSNRNRLLQDEEKDKEKEEEDEEEALEEDLEEEEKSNQELEEENESLEDENEELKEEIKELKAENAIQEEEEEELIDEENTELDEVIDEYDEDIMIVEEEEYEEAQAYVDVEEEQAEETLKEEIENADDDTTKEELNEELNEDIEDQEELDEEYEEDEEILDEYADEYADAADEEYEEFVEEEEEEEELEEEKNAIEGDVEAIDSKINEKDASTENADDDVYEEIAEEIYDEEEKEYEEEDDYWYWDEYPDYYDDDYYEDEYWVSYTIQLHAGRISI